MKKNIENIKRNSLTAVVFGMWVKDFVEVFQECRKVYKNIKNGKKKEI